MKLGRVAWAFSFVAVTTALSLASSGCVSVYATKHGFQGTSWAWASQDCVETTFGPPWSEANVELAEAKDHSVLLGGKFAGVRCGSGSPEERLLLGNALDSGVLRMRDEVYASYQIASGWKLPGAEVTTTGLILANDGDMCFVLARNEKGWVRCRSAEIKCNRGSAFKETVAITAWIPAWLGLAVVDAALIAIPFAGWYVEYEINRSI
jgi:hypothetical protein